MATTVMSTKGQVVIPWEIRRALKLRPGDDFVVVSDGKNIFMKKIQPDPPAVKVERKQKGRGLRP